MIELSGAVLEHANRGLRLQLLLRAALVVFLLLTVILIPPVQGATAYYVTVAAYATCAATFAGWAWKGGPSVSRWGWLGLFVDLAVLATLTLIAGIEAQQSWTSDVLVIGFFLLPVLAATQLRPGICAAVVIPTTAVYLMASLATQAANEEPWQSIVLRTFMLASVGAAAIGLSRIQRSRVRTIGGLLQDRTGLLEDLVHLEERERRDLSEQLHDGALQYVLAARLDLDDVREGGGDEAVARIDRALTESSRMLRLTVSELHPAVLEHAGLARAVRDLGDAQARGDLTVDVDVDDWPDGIHTPVDALLFERDPGVADERRQARWCPHGEDHRRSLRRLGSAGRRRRWKGHHRWRPDAEPRRRPHRIALATAAHRSGRRHPDHLGLIVGHHRHGGGASQGRREADVGDR